MHWDNADVFDLWSGPVSNRAAKEDVGRRVAENVRDGQVIGVGSGSTSYVAIQAIADRVQRDGLHISVICTSAEVKLACAAHDLQVTSLLQHRPDWSFDGADEVDVDHNLIKGRGGAMFMEKIVMQASPRNYILVDQSKLVRRLGEKFPIPVEILPVALHLVERELRKAGAFEIALRLAVKKDGPVVTEHGNFIFDVRFPEVRETLERDIKAIPGVVESGLFLGREVELIVADR
jgi:ribose 5-phosphate isomerase A